MTKSHIGLRATYIVGCSSSRLQLSKCEARVCDNFHYPACKITICRARKTNVRQIATKGFAWSVIDDATFAKKNNIIEKIVDLWGWLRAVSEANDAVEKSTPPTSVLTRCISPVVMRQQKVVLLSKQAARMLAVMSKVRDASRPADLTKSRSTYNHRTNIMTNPSNIRRGREREHLKRMLLRY